MYVDVSSINATQFIKECVITSQFDHPNVLSLIGVCVNIEDGAIHMVMPFMVHGDIRSYLRAKRGSAIEFDHFPEVQYVYPQMYVLIIVTVTMHSNLAYIQ